MSFLREYGRLILLLIVLAVVAFIYWKGQHDADTKHENKALRADNRAVSKSNKISRATQDRVGREGAATREQNDRDQRALDNATDTGAAGAADDPGVRVAEEAYERAIRAACRVQRTSACDVASAAP